MPKFVLILLPAINNAGVELTCAISGENDRWNGTTRTFASKEEVEDALRKSRVFPAVGPDVRIAALQSGLTTASFVEDSIAIGLQVLHRVDPHKLKVRTFVTFRDKRGGVSDPIAEYWLDRDIVVGDALKVNVAGFLREVTVEKVVSATTKKFGDDETRREVVVEGIL